MSANDAATIARLEDELRQSKESRQRAWRELQRLRAMLSAVVNLPVPGPRPKFETEGAILRHGVKAALVPIWMRGKSLLNDVEALRPHFTTLPASEELARRLRELDLSRARFSEILPTSEAMDAVGKLGL